MTTELQTADDKPQNIVVAEKPQTILEIISLASANPDTDADKMEKMLTMYERVMDREAEAAFNKAMMKTQKAIPVIKAEAINPHTNNSRYSKIEHIIEKIKPIYTRNGFALMFSEGEIDKPGYIRIICDVLHDKGHSKRFHADMPLDMAGPQGNVNKTPTHGTGSSMTYGCRYLTVMIFNVAFDRSGTPLDDDDGNAASKKQEQIEYITKGQALDIETMINDLTTAEFPNTKKSFLKALQVPDVDHIRASEYERAVNLINNKNSQRGLTA